MIKVFKQLTAHEWDELPNERVAEEYSKLIYHRAEITMPKNGYSMPSGLLAPLNQKNYIGCKQYPLQPTDHLTNISGCVDPEICIDYSLHNTIGIQGFHLDIVPYRSKDNLRYASQYLDERGMASGGGRYPLTIYRATRGSKQLPAGLYIYLPRQDTWGCLGMGDYSFVIMQEIEDKLPIFDDVLVVAINYWISSYKYVDFSYLVSTMDVGTFLASFVDSMDAVRCPYHIAFNVSEWSIAQLLHLNPLEEGIYALIGIGLESDSKSKLCPTNWCRIESWQRGQKTVLFNTIKAMQRAAVCEEKQTQKLTQSLEFSGISWISDFSANKLTAILKKRETSFGRFTGESMKYDDLIGILTSAVRGQEKLLKMGFSNPVEMHILSVNINGLDKGVYRLDSRFNCTEISTISHHELSNILLGQNYDLERIDSMITISSSLINYSKHHGVQGFREIAIQCAALSQIIHTKATDLGISAGTLLGFNAVKLKTILALDDGKEPIIIILLGHDAETGRFTAINFTGMGE